MERLLTIEDIAERLQIGRRRAADYARQMSCIVLPGGKRKRVTEQAFQAWLRANTEQPCRVHQRTGRRAVSSHGEWWNEKSGSA